MTILLHMLHASCIIVVNVYRWLLLYEYYFFAGSNSAFMPDRSHGTPQSAEHDADALLQQLIAEPPTPSPAWRRPVALRSREEQRRHALSGYLLRTWVDGLLHHTERLLIGIAVVVFGYWIYDGPARDWFYYQNQAISVAAAPAAFSPPNTAVARSDAPIAADPTIEPVPLPFTTPDMAAPVSEEFLVPQSARMVPTAIVEQEPQRLQIPAIALDTSIKQVFVVNGTWEVADYAAGYMHGTALPGEPGTMALAGHAGLRGGVFRDLGALAPGDDILIDAGGWRYRYRVREAFSVWPTQTEVLEPTNEPTLVLITCTNWDTQRLIVRADLIESKPLSS